eukprot:GEMP01019358.1.p1 GENE.GEMP01019358.1~~GEMP01019358.1.p1  ORF type:complete len:670 (+),score=127.26 GEMP01019358.1:39-2048(+)
MVEPKRMVNDTTDCWAVVILAAGYGSRLHKDIVDDTSEQFKKLLGEPKGLLPVGGVPLLDHWVRMFQQDCADLIGPVLLVTNERFYPRFRKWGMQRGVGENHVLSDGTTDNENRLGAVKDLQFILDRRRDVIGDRHVLVVAADTLFFHDFNLRHFLLEVPVNADGSVVYYDGGANCDTRKRGIIEVNRDGRILALLEKPLPSETTSRKCCPAFYAYRQSALRRIDDFVKENEALGRDAVDAPGKLLAYLVTRTYIHASEVMGRFDIGSLGEYRNTLDHFAVLLDQRLNTLTDIDQVTRRCYARAALMGNPSDGFGGKTLAMTVSNFYAEVTVRLAKHVTFVSHPEHDANAWDDLVNFLEHSEEKGYYGGVRLLKAATKKFAALCRQSGQSHILVGRSFQMSYDTTIPRMVGLAGSSAIVCAALQALLGFYALKWTDLGLKIEEVPQIVLDVEKEELGISAGLQDRVVQIYGGLVYMDFGTDIMKAHGFGRYESLSNVTLPPLYLCYNTQVGGDSGKVHSPVKERWLNGDAVIIDGMKSLGALTDEGVKCLKEQDYAGFGALMEKNFALRRSMYTDEVVGARNLEMIARAKEKGLVGKFTGSGGAIVCMKQCAPFELSPEEEEGMKSVFNQNNFEFLRLYLQEGRDDEASFRRSPTENVRRLSGKVLQVD